MYHSMPLARSITSPNPSLAVSYTILAGRRRRCPCDTSRATLAQAACHLDRTRRWFHEFRIGAPPPTHEDGPPTVATRSSDAPRYRRENPSLAIGAASTVWLLNWSAQQDTLPVATRGRNDWFGTRCRRTNRRPCPVMPADVRFQSTSRFFGGWTRGTKGNADPLRQDESYPANDGTDLAALPCVVDADHWHRRRTWRPGAAAGRRSEGVCGARTLR